MATYRYRAATLTGQLRTGTLQGSSPSDVLTRVRALGLLPIEAVKTADAATAKRVSPSAAVRQAVANAFSEISVLVGAGLPLDRALKVCAENTSNAPVRVEIDRLAKRVKEGVPLSAAIGESQGLLPVLASALAEAGEASGTLDLSLGKLAHMLERAEALRQTIVSAMIYPVILAVVAVSVILVMLMWIVPQFEALFSSGSTKLPPMTMVVIAASHFVRDYGLVVLAVVIACLVAVVQVLRRPSIRLTFDRTLLTAPLLGPVVRKAETAKFSRVLGNLVEGGVPLHSALFIAGRTLSNRHMANAIERVATGLKEGSGLSRPLQDAGILPPLALSFLRTGEETAQLGPMLNRLSDVLDRDVRTSIDRLVSVLTPAVTIVMGLVVATVIASIMTAILGFNDLAVGS